MRLKALCFGFVLFLFTNNVLAQRQESENACAKTLNSARSSYEQGRIEEVPGLLEDCLKNGFNDVEMVEAYKLLILSYLYYDERAAAENAMLNFLKFEPEYEINPVVDPPEFINLYNSFRTNPIFLIGAKAGGNATFVDVEKNYSLSNTASSTGTYRSKVGYQVGLTLDVPLSKKFSIATELNLIANTYEYTKKQLQFSSLLYTEEQMWGELPLFVRYNFGSSKLKYYVQVGGAVSYLLSAEANVERTDSVNIEVGNRSVSGPSIDLTPQRESLNYSIVGGFGLKMKDVLGNGYLLFDVRYSHGLPNVVNTDARYNNNELQYQYLYVDNDYSIKNAFVSLGYYIPIYKPKVIKKRKKKRKG
ncbi:porin family protein [Fulvivirga aurantia]|uniref:porin family protein n=1 Tax=Fulvivirga aurantia TaxID=2529383 RepID=UPI001624755F|nr:porin family protein [Fulvivirga aurantia]